MVGLQQIHEARERIASVIASTPVLSSRTINELSGNAIYLKGEHLQKTGSFKIRGAANKVLYEFKNGAKYVVAASSGNHGQAVAYIAHQLGIRATIVVPENAAQCKLDAIRAYQGEIELCGSTSEERIERAKYICKRDAGTYIPPYDDSYIIAGQGTTGLEILEQLNYVDTVYVPIGGGGLISGVAVAIKETMPSIRVIGVEPAMAADTFTSILKGNRTKLDTSMTIADGLRTSVPGEITFPIIQKYVDEVVLVEEEEIKAAFSLVLSRMKQVIEPSGAVSMAAALSHKGKGEKIIALISGGNVDTEVIPQLLVKNR